MSIHSPSSKSSKAYLVINERVQVTSAIVYGQDVMTVYCADAKLQDRLMRIVVYEFKIMEQQRSRLQRPEKQKTGKTVIGDTRQILSPLYILQKISEAVQEESELELELECIVANDCIVEWVPSREMTGTRMVRQKALRGSRLWEILKVLLVCVLCFFGGAFSIMAFHNDVGLDHIFAQVYELVTGTPSDGFTVLEVSYSIGLMLGIVIFYGHIGKHRISKDPTPIEVSMRSYEQEMNHAMSESWEREGKKIDVR